MSAVIVLAQALPSASSGMDWLYQFTNNLTNLTTQNGGALTQLGLTELSCIALFTLVSMVINWNTSNDDASGCIIILCVPATSPTSCSSSLCAVCC